MRRRGALVVACLLVASGCGERVEYVEPPTVSSSDEPSSDVPPSPDGEPERDPGPVERSAPPPVTLSFGDRSLELEAYTFCFGNLCADGMPPDDPPSVGSVEEVRMEYPLADWHFTATFVPAEQPRCGRMTSVPVESDEDGDLVITPQGRAGSYDVTLFGRGNGDMITTFHWRTPVDGPMPQPRARLALVADGDGGPTSYGVELSLVNLASTPRQAEAEVTVTAAEGRSLTFALTHPGLGCPEGSVYWERPDGPATEAAELGQRPFTYDVSVTLDGVRHTATARWPDDVIRGNAPSVRLQFEPPLPALG